MDFEPFHVLVTGFGVRIHLTLVLPQNRNNPRFSAVLWLQDQSILEGLLSLSVIPSSSVRVFL